MFYLFILVTGILSSQFLLGFSCSFLPFSYYFLGSMLIPSSPYSVTQLTISCFILYFLLCLLFLVLLPVCYFPRFCSPVFCCPPVSYSSYWPSVFMRVFIIRCLHCSLSHWSFLVCFYLFFKSLCASRVTLSFFCWTFVYYIHPRDFVFWTFLQV